MPEINKFGRGKQSGLAGTTNRLVKILHVMFRCGSRRRRRKWCLTRKVHPWHSIWLGGQFTSMTSTWVTTWPLQKKPISWSNVCTGVSHMVSLYWVTRTYATPHITFNWRQCVHLFHLANGVRRTVPTTWRRTPVTWRRVIKTSGTGISFCAGLVDSSTHV
jgi:hypothetical protein